MLGGQEEDKRKRYALAGVVALAILLIVGALAAQRPQSESLEHHEHLARLGLEDDGAKPKPKPKPKLPPALLRKMRCRRAAGGVARRLAMIGRLCSRLGKKPINKKRCIMGIKSVFSFPLVHVADEPKEFARGRKPVTLVFDCAKDYFKFAMGKSMGKPKKKISVGWNFGPKPFRVVASACSPKGVSAFLQPPTEVVKMQGQKVKILGRDTVLKFDTKVVRFGRRRRRRRLMVTKVVLLGIFDIPGRLPKLGTEDGLDYVDAEEEMDDVQEDDFEME